MLRAFVGAFLGTFIAIMTALALYAAIGPGLPSFCNDNQTGLSCLRDWIGAMSGYAAAIGAFIAASLTVPLLTQQAREAGRQADEAKRQADFLLGDGLPTLDVVEHQRDSEQLIVRVQNWNRRTVFLLAVEFADPPIRAGIIAIAVDDEDIPRDIGAEFNPPVRVPGYVTQEAGPSEARIAIMGFDAHTKPIAYWPETLRIRVHLQIVGSAHDKVALEADVLTYSKVITIGG